MIPCGLLKQQYVGLYVSIQAGKYKNRLNEEDQQAGVRSQTASSAHKLCGPETTFKHAAEAAAPKEAGGDPHRERSDPEMMLVETQTNSNTFPLHAVT